MSAAGVSRFHESARAQVAGAAALAEALKNNQTLCGLR